jgi:hypothetical protein
MVPLNFPEIYYGSDMVYDENTKEILLFGGAGVVWPSGTPVCETWAYNSTTNNWTNRHPTFFPGGMAGHTMVYDRRNKEAILHYNAENWVYSSATNNWSRFAIASNPPGNTRVDMAYDDNSGATFLLSGGTWVWNDTRLSDSGTFISAVHETGGPAYFGCLGWDCTPAMNGTIGLQFRSAADSEALRESVFVGPDGKPSSYYNRSGQMLNACHNGSRVFQYKVYLTAGDERLTPIVDNISIQYNVLHTTEVRSPDGLENWTGIQHITWSADDPDNDPLAFDIYLIGEVGNTMLVSGLSNSTRSWTWDTSTVPNGTYKILVVARDENPNIPLTANASSRYEFTIFHPPPENHPPEVILLSPEDKSTIDTTEVELSWNGSDADGDPLNYSVLMSDEPFWAWNRPAPLTVTNETNRTVSALVDGSTYFWTVVANDGRNNGSAPATRSFTVRLPPPNTPPVVHLLYPANGSTLNSTAIEFAWVGTDADNDRLSYRLFISDSPFDISSLPMETVHTRETRYLCTNMSNNASYYWTVMATDGKDNVTAELRAFRVNMTYKNHAPVIISTPPGSARIGEEYVYNVSARDDDGDPLIFSLAIDISGMAINSTTGRLAWAPVKSQVGSNRVAVRVTDCNGAGADQSFMVTVIDPANVQRPVCEITLPANGSGVRGDIFVTGRVVRGSLPTVAVQIRIDGGEWLNATGAEEWSLSVKTTLLRNGAHTIEARAFDGNLYSDIASTMIEVNNQTGVENGPVDIHLIMIPFAVIVILVAAGGITRYYRRRAMIKK